jgi:DeoR family transcriptional regulator, fructose operon transcriptional repressor
MGSADPHKEDFMLTEERHRIILEQLKLKNIVKINELVEITNSSESTIRRDLTYLEQGKYLKRVHGGAAGLQGKLKELTESEKTTKNIQEKIKIAQFAASLVKEGDCLFIDAGTTTFHMIDYLPEVEVVVVTNGISHVDRLLQKGFKTYLIGGMIKPTTKAMIGGSALQSLSHYRFDKAFIGINGIHHQYGFTTPDPEEAQIKKASLDLSREAFILADSSKFGEISFSKVADIGEAVVITNHLEIDQAEAFQNQRTIKVVTS